MTSIVDDEQTLTTIGQLAVRDVADYFVFDRVEADGHVRRIQVRADTGDQRQSATR